MSHRKKILLILVSMTIIRFSGLNSILAQEDNSQLQALEKYFSKLPTDLILDESKPQKYLVTTHWHNRDVKGNGTGKFIINGEYTRDLNDQIVRWNSVRIEVFQDPTKSNSDTLLQNWMEGLSYKSPDDLANPDLYNKFPTDESKHLLRTLLWDAIAFEIIGWNYFDKLKLNETLKASDYENFTAPMADWGSLIMRDLKLTWIGISKMNNEICALIQFESFANPVQSFGILGRSLYWGRIWVSLEDKQIEYGKLNEDIIMEIVTTHEAKKFLNIQREVEFKKIE